MKLDEIGFYTLTDYRASQISGFSPLWRCELLITDRCNFKCPYCRGMEVHGDMSVLDAFEIISRWSNCGLKNIRFSGGEPTLHPGLLSMVDHAKRCGVERIAISTNGSADNLLYTLLVDAGVDDFSISLDACCSNDMDKMTGVKKQYEKVLNSIWYIATVLEKYVTIGIVLTKSNIDRVKEIVSVCNWLGVADIRIIPSAQDDMFLSNAKEIDERFTEKFPILNYRVSNVKKGLHVRGLKESDQRCYLVMDDMAVMGEDHYPCIIYLREGGKPIGKITDYTFREDRFVWSKNHDCFEDKICRKNCLDVCRAFNRRCAEYGNKNS
jgi:MoaA/NifB/PqqE/SkfB family radical SAM enzyme